MHVPPNNQTPSSADCIYLPRRQPLANLAGFPKTSQFIRHSFLQRISFFLTQVDTISYITTTERVMLLPRSHTALEVLSVCVGGRESTIKIQDGRSCLVPGLCHALKLERAFRTRISAALGEASRITKNSSENDKCLLGTVQCVLTPLVSEHLIESSRTKTQGGNLNHPVQQVKEWTVHRKQIMGTRCKQGPA